MIIEDHRTLRSIKEEFHSKYPNLKIEFYSKPHAQMEGSSVGYLIDDSLTIDQVRSQHNAGDLSIHPSQKVSTLESNFEDMYGLHVQVFRKSGEIWLQTTVTDDWTLASQNDRN